MNHSPLSSSARLTAAKELLKSGTAVFWQTQTTREDLDPLLPDASQTQDGEQTFFQALALGQFDARPQIVDPAWKLTRVVFLHGCQAAHYNPRDGRLYVGTCNTDSDGLYAIDPEGGITRIADTGRVGAVAVHPEEGHIFVAQNTVGKIYRTACGSTGRETWVSDFKGSDSDPMGMAFATADYVGKLLAPG